MNPRSFLNFFRTRTGKLLVFGVLFAGGLLMLVSLRQKEPPIAVVKDLPPTNDVPQVVQTVQRTIDLFRPPPPKPELSPVFTNQIGFTTNITSTPPQPPLSLLAEVVGPEPQAISPNFAPYGRLIPCETVITVDSASIQTPIIGLITENIYHAGRLVIPAGTEVHGSAQTDRHRERISSGNSWTLVWQTGEELRLKAIILDREFSGNQEGWGITDGSAGLRGELLKSDNLAEIKLFAAALLSGAAGAVTEKEQTIFGTHDRPSLNNAPYKGAQDVLKVYAQRIYDAIERDGFYVRVPSGKQFYLYVLQTIDRADAVLAGGASPFTKANIRSQEHVQLDSGDAPIRP